MNLPVATAWALPLSGARLESPRALALGLVVAALFLAGLRAAFRRRALLREVAGELAPRVAPGASLERPLGQLALSCGGLALLAVALAGPQCGTRAELARRYGVDLVIALDVSRSMLARDVAPDRLSHARLEASALLDRLRGDRVGVVLFARDARVACPLTTDRAAARLLLRAASPASVPAQGTSLASALAAAGRVLSAAEPGARARAVIVLSDGEDQEPGALDAAAALARAGVRVFTVAIGTAEGAPIPEGPEGAAVHRDRDGREVTTRVEERLLREIAVRTGGRAFAVQGAELGLPGVEAELDGMERAELESRMTVAFEEREAVFALPAFLLLLAALLLPQACPAPRRPEAR